MAVKAGRWQVAGAVVLAGVLGAGAARADHTVIASGSDKLSVMIYGQVNRAFLWADDGDESKVFFVDNKNSSTRFGFDAKAKGDTLTAGANFEAEFLSNSSGSVSRVLESESATLSERKMDVYLSGGFGKLSLGQGDTASNGTSEIDLSGTTVVAYSAIEDMAGGIPFFDKGLGGVWEDEAAGKTTPKVKDVFDTMDGFSRDDRVRYDSPKLAGFMLSASTGTQKFWDVALRYAGEFAGTKVEAAVAYGDPADKNKLMESQVNGSLSVALPMGLSVTAAAGQQKLDDPARNDDPAFWYGKVAYGAKFTDAGTTTFGVDYEATNDMKKDKDEAKSMGVFVVQKLDALNTELYLAYRTHQLDRTGKDYVDVAAVMGGARIKF